MITSEEILKYSEWIKNGAEIENPKIELKQQWWNLEEDLSQNEFLKDVTSMANTPGNTGYIIIGIDKNGELHDALVPIDSSKIRGIICKHIQDPMDIEVYQISVGDKSISIIEIPESLNKPHVIKVYRTSKQTINMYIPIRKGTSINPANKYDNVAKGWKVYKRSDNSSEQRKCLTTRKDGVIVIKIGPSDNNRKYMNVSIE